MPPMPSRTTSHVVDGIALLTSMFRREAPATDGAISTEDGFELTTESDYSLVVE